MDSISESLLASQKKAEALFADVVGSGLIAAGKLESELSDEIHAVARARHGLRRHWHRRIARSGPNTLLGYHDAPADRRIAADDIVYLDFGPVFEDWEADFGRTYTLGTDPEKHRLVSDLARVFERGKALFGETPELTCGGLYDAVVALAREHGWEFGAKTAGHLIGQFPHETAPGDAKRFSIRQGNAQRLREPDAAGRQRHWILEVHLVDRARQIGGFYEELLTV